uniref:Amine oxidase n=1 Tax=Colletotrichum fructicola (strain Nara gc5) TaxID=1213859 RepID=L2GIL9_COLFN
MIDKTAEMSRSRDGFVWTPQSGFSYGLRTPAVVSSTPHGELSDKYDVIVIGAGFAGLSAARDLAFAGKSVLLVEARDRIGGRTWTAHSERGESYEMGGTWIHWQQPHVFAEVQRYGLDDFIETNAVPEGCTIYSKANATDPVISRSSQEANKTLAKIEMLMARLLDVDGKGGRTVIPFPFDTRSSMRNNTLYSQIDELSIKDRVAQMTDLSQEERIMIEAHASSFFGIPSNDAAFSAVLYTYALCSFDPKTTEDAIMRYKLSKGTTSLALAILNDFKGHRIFSSLVKSISQTDEPYGVSVTLESGKEFNSKAIITTIPMTILSRTEFNPPLSLLRQAAAFADGTRNGEPLLTFLTHPGHKLDSDEEKLRLIETLHPQGLTLTSARAHLWSEDPLAGGIMPVRKAGFLRKYYEEAHRPHGRVYFCGSDFADGWRGFISGAFESSYRVTREVLQHLNE